MTNSTGTVGGTNVYDHLSLYLVLGGRQQSITPYAWLVGIYGGGNNSFDGRGYWTAQDFLAVFYKRLVPDTAEHESSMLQDLTAGKRTEIDALNGAVIRLANEHGLQVAYNGAVYRLIKFLESRPGAK